MTLNFLLQEEKMAKKTGLLNYLYCCGMAITVIGFCCPIIKSKFLGIGANGFKLIDFGESSFVSIGAILIFCGAVAGIISQFVPQLKSLKLIFLLASVAGGVILVLGFSTGGYVAKFIGKSLLKNISVGFYLVICGWIVACLGYFTGR